ncbi:calcium/proton exchanger [Rhizophagus irregularis]|uniref:Vacuolar calcium ion transporter n=1 Tax=Rhizophagus irregularis TaxID=588596 RepID=A0A2I1EER9_9GLOM|nr:calcium/proton exchanger [Rhizophagus irregularis]PKY20619.1 calcium/proton exchanger [Rhizophagus irregularis]CAB4491066.1 unnamed protein product [Rhizophagus irregularis]CAB5206268.1 unnamed protein product [Rhizophagus irregularis]CAB5374698.1 unnamed protein product [Rhizophagus irregularis]
MSSESQRKSSNSSQNDTNINTILIPSPPSSPVLHSSSAPPTLLESLKIIFLSSWINVLLIFVPLGYIAFGLKWSNTLVFVLNFLAIIPLSKLLEFATEDIGLRIGQTSGVLKATFVLGLCFVMVGIYHKEQNFNMTAAQTSSSLMALACIGLIIPAAFISSVKNAEIIQTGSDHTSELLNLSHGTAIIFLIIYVLYLLFQLKTHTHLYQDEEEIENDEQPQLTFTISLLLLIVVTVAVSFSAEYLVSSIEGIVNTFGLSKTFIGLILLPIVGKAPELLTVAMKNKMDLAINIAADSSMQTALFISPLLVILGWITGQQMTMFFQTFETIALFISVLIINYLIQGGQSNWLKGAMLLVTYIIIALAFFFYPNNDK